MGETGYPRLSTAHQHTETAWLGYCTRRSTSIYVSRERCNWIFRESSSWIRTLSPLRAMFRRSTLLLRRRGLKFGPDGHRRPRPRCFAVLQKVTGGSGAALRDLKSPTLSLSWARLKRVETPILVLNVGMVISLVGMASSDIISLRGLSAVGSLCGMSVIEHTHTQTAHTLPALRRPRRFIYTMLCLRPQVL